MNSRGLLRRGAAIGFLLGLVWATFPPPADAAFNVGAQLWFITPSAGAGVDPTCDTQGGTSMAIVPGPKLAGVDPVQHPVVLAITCLDNGGSSTAVQRRSRVNFLNLSNGQVVKSIQTTIGGVVSTPSNGWAHLVHRPDFGDLLGCANDGSIWSIDFSQVTSTADGTATQLPRPSGLPNNCAGLGWDAEEDMIYQGVTGGTGIVGVYRFKSGTTTLVLPSFNTPCAPTGVAITGGVVVVACDGISTILRLDKNTGGILGVNGTLGVLGFLPGTSLNPDLGDLACDPVSFAGQFKDAMWSRNGFNGNGVVALEFPAFTCGLPSNATVLAAGLSGPAFPAGCLDGAGNVKDTDGDGLPDCWETNGIDFDGDGTVDLPLCVQVDTNGDGVPDATECADPNHKDLFVEIDYMQFHKPDPKALSQTQSVVSVGVKSVREAFAAAPVGNVNPPDVTTGIRAHFQVDEQVTFFSVANPLTPKSHVNEVTFTPCTGPASFAIDPNEAADFDAIKKANFGTLAERASANTVNTLNAKRLAFRYVLFAHKQVGTSPAGGSGSSGCAEVEGDDAVVTLGAFTTTTVEGVSHPRGTTDHQAGTFMHELGHTLGLRHGGFENLNCKPNYLSVMSYSRQFAGSPIPNRRLDYSGAVVPGPLGLNEAILDEFLGLGLDPSLGPEPPFFPSADQTAFGPSAWSVVPANAFPINWNRSKQGPNPTFQPNASANINQGPGGCDGAGTFLGGHDDWGNLLYRFSAALDFAGGVRTDTPQEITKAQEEEFFLAADLDANGIADAQDCGTFLCTHRIDIKPSFPVPKVINLGAEATITIAIFSEREMSGAQVWNAPALVLTATLTFGVESLVFPVKVNNKGGGTCSTSDVADPVTGQKDGIKDLKCQFPTSGLPLGTHQGVVSGFFLQGGELRAFRARQDFTVVP